MAKLTDYTEATRFDANDILIKDGTNGTKKIKVANAASEFAGLISIAQRRNIYRGKYLGSSVTSAQKAAIQNGTFDDLFIWDYWTINGIDWVILDFNYWYNCGDTAFNKNHLVVGPRKALYSRKMNETNTTEGGYVGSLMYKEGLAAAKTAFSQAFGSMVLTHREYLTNAVTNGHPSAGGWFDSTVDLMNEIMVYGSYIHTPANDGVTIPTRYTINKQQLAAFALNPRSINNRETIWLRDVVSAAYFALVASYGFANCDSASTSYGVRPVAAIG